MLKKFLVSGSLAAGLIGGIFASEFSEAQAKIKARYPKEYAEVQTLAATDMAAAQKKLSELARKGNIRLPGAAGENGSRRFQRGGRQGNMNFRGIRQGRSGRGGAGMMRFGRFDLLKRFAAESQIKSKYAAEYAAADKQLLEAAAKIEELAKKAKVSLPLSTEFQIRKLRAEAPQEFARLEAQSASDPRKTFSGLRELSEKHKIPLYEQPAGGRRMERPAAPPQGAARENPNALLRRLRRKYPEEMAAIMPLRDSDPREFARKIRELDKKDKLSRKKGE